ncbi:unnamed protein product [Rotaria sordida]|nr:unnamed protein product [Rotaria sordida]CAF0813252.1 unnamed protein product [Rotaria sordida]CAF0815895.1 unnamed protein product [Rotaria sordida]
MNSVERPLIQRRVWNENLSLEQREAPIFTEAHRKFQNEALDIHNVLRARHCVPPLVLDEEINIRAQKYADQLASTNSKLIHSTDRGDQFGENLYVITRKHPITDISAAAVILTWYDEIKLYDYDHPGYKPSVGHFSQLVWKDTQKIGIAYAMAKEGHKMYVVAQYSPAGNYDFEYETCVLQPLC